MKSAIHASGFLKISSKGDETMDYIETSGYCNHCKKEVNTRRPIPETNKLHKSLSVLSAGFWPLYRLRVGWRCGECGKNADNEKPHLVGRSMGGLRPIEKLEAPAFCPHCQQTVTVWRKLPPPSSLHTRMSLFSAGVWPVVWLRSGWLCEQCQKPVEDESLFDPGAVMESHGHCPDCDRDIAIYRKVPLFKFSPKLASFFTLGGWPFHWLNFGWRCSQCHSPDEQKAPLPTDYIEYRAYCPSCDQAVSIRRKVPRLNFMHRILAGLSGGYWPISWLRKGWRCGQCNNKVEADPFAFKKTKPSAAQPAEPPPEQPAGPAAQPEPGDNR